MLSFRFSIIMSLNRICIQSHAPLFLVNWRFFAWKLQVSLRVSIEVGFFHLNVLAVIVCLLVFLSVSVLECEGVLQALQVHFGRAIPWNWFN